MTATQRDCRRCGCRLTVDADLCEPCFVALATGEFAVARDAMAARRLGLRAGLKRGLRRLTHGAVSD